MNAPKRWITLSIICALVVGVTSCATGVAHQQRDNSLETTDDGPRQVTVLYVADLHGQLEPHPELFWDDDGEDRLEMAGGFARVAAAIQSIREERAGEVLVLDAGDTIQGSGAAALTRGEAIVPALNALGLDAAIPGNWEVAYGPDVLRERMAQLDYDIFAANLREEASGARLFPPYIVRAVGGVRVGVVGYTDPDVPFRQPPAYSEGLAYTDAAELPGLVEELRREHGAEVVLLLSHVGLPKAVALTDGVPGLDAHLSGDTHERTYEPIDRDGVWVVEPGAFGSFLGRLDLWIDADGEVVDRRWELIELTAANFPDEDARVQALVDEAIAPLHGELSTVVGHADGHLARYNVIETSLDNLLADALRDATGTEIALSNGFRFGNPLPPGPIREADLWNFYPVVTKLKTGKVTGAQIRAFWERELENVFATDPTQRFGGWLPRPSGMTVIFEAGAPAGERVREIKVHGEPLDDERLYTLTACEREGDDEATLCRIPDAVDTEIHEIDAHEAVRRYLGKHERVERRLEGRVIGLDLPRVLRTQM